MPESGMEILKICEKSNFSLYFENGGFSNTIVTDQPEIGDALNRAKGELMKGNLVIDRKNVKLCCCEGQPPLDRLGKGTGIIGHCTMVL
ncbi:MAG: hypothetical protein PHR69_11025 [Sphaerochaeta sp.]|nr:hypothetical protein [Sphaerochaeta sp.]